MGRILASHGDALEEEAEPLANARAALINVLLVFHSGDLDGRLVVAAAGLCREDPSVDGNLFLVRPPKQRLAQDTAIMGCTGRNTLEGQDRRHEIDVTYRDTDLDATLEIDAPGEAGVMDGSRAHAAMIARLAAARARIPRSVHQVGPCQPKAVPGRGRREGEEDIGTTLLVRQMD
jgi:hypothetical protein